MSLSVLVQSSLRTQDFTLLIVVGVGPFVGDWIAFANGERGVGIALHTIHVSFLIDLHKFFFLKVAFIAPREVSRL